MNRGARLLAGTNRLGREVVDDPKPNLVPIPQIAGEFGHIGFGQVGSDSLGEHPKSLWLAY
jgi:hypothetical protein